MAGGDAWIGGSDGDVEGSWVWMDSEDGFNIRKWSPGKKPERYYTFHVVSNRLFIPFHCKCIERNYIVDHLNKTVRRLD